MYLLIDREMLALFKGNTSTPPVTDSTWAKVFDTPPENPVTPSPASRIISEFGKLKCESHANVSSTTNCYSSRLGDASTSGKLRTTSTTFTSVTTDTRTRGDGFEGIREVVTQHAAKRLRTTAARGSATTDQAGVQEQRRFVPTCARPSTQLVRQLGRSDGIDVSVSNHGR